MVESLIEYGDTVEKIEKRVKEFLMILLACSDHPIKLDNYSDIDEIKKADDFDTIYLYEKLVEKVLKFNWNGLND